jgi:hypothetical protein
MRQSRVPDAPEPPVPSPGSRVVDNGEVLRIRPAGLDDHDAIWTILEPVLRAGDTYTLPRDIGRDERFGVLVQRRA